MKVAEAVREVLKTYPYLNEFLQEGIINASALARKIAPAVKGMTGLRKVQHEAIMVSILRYASELKGETAAAVMKVVAESTLTVKTDMMYLNVQKTVSNLKALEEFYPKIRWSDGDIFFIVQGISEILVVVDRKNYQPLLKKLGDREARLQYKSTAIVILHSPAAAAGPGLPGLIAYVTTPISKAGISIEILTMSRDTIILVEESDLTRAFNILKEMIENCRRVAG